MSEQIAGDAKRTWKRWPELKKLYPDLKNGDYGSISNAIKNGEIATKPLDDGDYRNLDQQTRRWQRGAQIRGKRHWLCFEDFLEWYEERIADLKDEYENDPRGHLIWVGLLRVQAPTDLSASRIRRRSELRQTYGKIAWNFAHWERDCPAFASMGNGREFSMIRMHSIRGGAKLYVIKNDLDDIIKIGLHPEKGFITREAAVDRVGRAISRYSTGEYGRKRKKKPLPHPAFEPPRPFVTSDRFKVDVHGGNSRWVVDISEADVKTYERWRERFKEPQPTTVEVSGKDCLLQTAAAEMAGITAQEIGRFRNKANPKRGSIVVHAYRVKVARSAGGAPGGRKVATWAYDPDDCLAVQRFNATGEVPALAGSIAVARKNRGRPRGSDWRRDEDIEQAWKRAQGAGVTAKDFAPDNDMTDKELYRLVERVALRRKRLSDKIGPNISPTK